MKHLVNFRLSVQTINMLTLLEKKLHHTKTAIVENALQMYAKKELMKQKNLLQFAGAISEHDANAMLTSITENKNNKETDITL